jgi:hypothetical protein
MITGLGISPYIYGDGSGWKVERANRREGGKGGVSGSAQWAVGVNGPSLGHWWECVRGHQ